MILQIWEQKCYVNMLTMFMNGISFDAISNYIGKVYNSYFHVYIFCKYISEMLIRITCGCNCDIMRKCYNSSHEEKR